MIRELKPAESLPLQKCNIRLHSEIVKILFENKRFIKNIFSNLKGLYGITHLGMVCIDPSQELVAFSTTPNIEYNLFNQKLWLEDHCFNLDCFYKNSSLWWDYQNEKIEKIKLKNNGLTIGMAIYRPINNFDFIYSFATNEKIEGLHQFYSDNLLNLIDVGDYFYKSLRELYSNYSLKHLPPDLNAFNSKATRFNTQPFLRLVQV